MTGRNVMVIAVLAAVVVASTAVFVTLPRDENKGSPDPYIPGHDIPDLEPNYPEGVSLNPETGALSYVSEVTWSVTDELAAYMDRNQ